MTNTLELDLVDNDDLCHDCKKAYGGNAIAEECDGHCPICGESGGFCQGHTPCYCETCDCNSKEECREDDVFDKESMLMHKNACCGGACCKHETA